MVAIYVPLFRTGIPEALLKFMTLLNNINWGQDLSMGPQKFGMTGNLVIVESLRVFENKSRERGMKTNANYKLVMKDLISHLFHSKALQRQKRYLGRALYKHHDTNIRNFV